MTDLDGVAYGRKVSQVTDLLRGRWTVRILCAMRTEPVRLGKLTRLVPSASKKTFRASLRELESKGIVVRRDMSNTVLHVEYDFANDMREVVCSLLDYLVTNVGYTSRGNHRYRCRKTRTCDLSALPLDFVNRL